MTTQPATTPNDHAEASRAGRIKCVVWDLDNTLWNGTLVEQADVTVVPEMLEIIRELDERGILHSIASKNDDDLANERLEELGMAAIHDIADEHGLWSPGQTIFCDGCGASIDVELVAPGGHGWTRDGGAWCSDCRPRR